MVAFEISNEFIAMIILGTMVGFMAHFLYRTCRDGSWTSDEQEPEIDYPFEDVHMKVLIRKDLIDLNENDERNSMKEKLNEKDLDDCTKRALYLWYKNSME